eukprot:TRINITY_DN41085_c0_g1_i1.p1 TRINITY_DN41085_c0_g1~~TRINITY_DN41085_c0_g1_i1.p1  ORF type:complete len:332 (+),score=46.69 TRINITY_DN41085_c0_g1_i1:21-1016(+)
MLCFGNAYIALMFRLLVAFFTSALVAALHPRPEFKDTASFARWLVHESDYGVVATHHGAGGVFGNIISIADGDGPEDSTGVVYTYIPSLDATYKDLMANPNVTITWSEMALENGTSGGCKGSTAENPPCGRVTISGKLTKVPEANKSTALKYLFATHPIMKDWSQAHVFEPFWLEPSSMDEFFVINMFGGAHPITRDDYFAADWYRKEDLTNKYVCGICGHVYDADKEGKGVPFEKLPDDWTCPVCGSPKSSYKKATRNGKQVWVHDEVEDDKYVCSVCSHVYDSEKDGKGVPFEKLPDDWTCPVCGSPKSSYKKATRNGKEVWVHDEVVV